MTTDIGALIGALIAEAARSGGMVVAIAEPSGYHYHAYGSNCTDASDGRARPMSGYRRRDILHSPGCEFLRPDGIACTCGSFARELAAAKLARTTTTEASPSHEPRD